MESLQTSAETHTAAWQTRLFGAVVILGLGGYKLIVAMEKGRTNVGFLVVMAIVSLGLLMCVCEPPRLSCRGRHYLVQLQHAFDCLKDVPGGRPSFGSGPCVAASCRAVWPGGTAGHVLLLVSAVLPQVLEWRRMRRRVRRRMRWVWRDAEDAAGAVNAEGHRHVGYTIGSMRRSPVSATPPGLAVACHGAVQLAVYPLLSRGLLGRRTAV